MTHFMIKNVVALCHRNPLQLMSYALSGGKTSHKVYYQDNKLIDNKTKIRTIFPKYLSNTDQIQAPVNLPLPPGTWRLNPPARLEAE